MTLLHVLSEERCNNSYRAAEEYGSWNESYSFQVKEVRLTPPANWLQRDDITVDFPVAVGDILFVLSCRYGDGDSFGHASGKGEVLWVFKSARTAEKAKEALLESEDYRVEIEIESGKKIHIPNLGSGYFSDLESVNIESFTVEL